MSSSPEEHTGLAAADWERLTSRILAICRNDRYLRAEAMDWTHEIIGVVVRDESQAAIRSFEQAFHYALKVLEFTRKTARRLKIRGEKVISLDQDTDEARRVMLRREEASDGETPQSLYEREEVKLPFLKLRHALHECVSRAASKLTEVTRKLFLEYHNQREGYDGDLTKELSVKYGMEPGAVYTRISRALNKLSDETLKCMSSKGYSLPEDVVKDYIGSYINEIQKGNPDE